MKQLFSSKPFYQNEAIGGIRLVVGLLMVFHGQEVLRPDVMQGYLTWDAFQGSGGKFLVYLGKSAELVSGLLLTAGFLTRIACLLLMGTLTYVTFFIGQGRFWYEDQHPFMFVLFGALFFFTGPGTWSIDQFLKRNSS
jgi:putative oxidoreductase